MASENKEEQYTLLRGDEDSPSSEYLPRMLIRNTNYDSDRGFTSRFGVWRSLAVVFIIVFSLATSFALGFKVRGMHSSGMSPYLDLEYSQDDIMWWNTNFSNMNASDAETNELWDTKIPWESGIIALTNQEAKAMSLPESQPWPWDAKNKQIYIVNAHHLLHCVRNLYISIQQYRTKKPQTIAYPHILHCLDSLRADTMCTADDTLRYIPLNSVHGFRPGDGQKRKCRNWDKVQQFVDSHDPCYRYLEPGNKELNNLERFKFCPAGSQYLPIIQEYFDYDHHWYPDPQEGPRELEW